MEKQNQSQKSELGPNWAYRGQGFSNLLRMGHCAPTVMQTILDVSSTEKEWLVKLSAGMPGGIGNTGFECGAVTSPLALLGIHYGLREVDRGLPVIFDKGHALCRPFCRLPQYSAVPGDPRQGSFSEALHSGRSCVRRSFFWMPSTATRQERHSSS